MQISKIHENHSHVGYFCDVKRGKSSNQRWSVYFNGEFLARFNKKKQAVQYAEHRVWAMIKDVYISGDLS